ncbi:MAG: sigma-70 family RNA polymerase sigma factor [Verrucomicrobiales bacterium]|nr:sigma-70 family RNA polymerase sigma factor [Verrucomicrobiales bacterium]
MTASPIQFEEGQILAGVALGREAAMETCISVYGGLIWSIALRYADDRSQAEDVVQETFMDLWKSAGRYDAAVASEKTFVGLLARRRSIDYMRKQRRQPPSEPLMAAESLPEELPEGSGERRVEHAAVLEMLKELPEATRELFTLHFEQGLTHPEIVERTGLPLGTVKTRLRRGLIELRNRLRHLDGPHSNPLSAS